MPDNFPIIKWSAVDSAIERAKSIEELNGLRSRIQALHLLSKQSRKSLETQNKISACRLRVDRKRGQWLRENVQNGGDRRSKSQSARLTLKAIGLTNQESYILQRIASVPEREFTEHLVATMRAGEELTTASLLRLETELRFKARKAPPLPKGKFSVVYADPPIKFEFAHGRITSASDVYETMTLEEICEFGAKVRALSARDCVCLLWLPAAHFEKAAPILRAWGFEPRSKWVWVKDRRNFSQYCAMGHEDIYIGGRARSIPTCDAKTLQSVHSVQTFPVPKGHSAKPPQYYELIERLWPCGNYLELFSRQKAPRKGWTFWGNEVRG